MVGGYFAPYIAIYYILNPIELDDGYIFGAKMWPCDHLYLLGDGP